MHDLISAIVSRPLGWLLDALVALLARLPWAEREQRPWWRP
jgi:hypothetical protein